MMINIMNGSKIRNIYKKFYKLINKKNKFYKFKIKSSNIVVQKNPSNII